MQILPKVNPTYNKKKRFVLKMTTFVPANQKLANMTANKQFNTYKEGLDLEVLRRNCMEYGGGV